AFQVAWPRGVDCARGLFFQEARRGTPVTTLLDGSGWRDLLEVVGATHRDLHGLDLKDVPAWDAAAFLETLSRHVDWIGFFLPEHAGFFNDLHRELVSQRPPLDETRHAFCHSDFRCSQLLMDGGRCGG